MLLGYTEHYHISFVVFTVEQLSAALAIKGILKSLLFYIKNPEFV